MATRFYLPRNGSAPATSPAFSAGWEKLAGSGVRENLTRTTPSNTSMGTVTTSANGTNPNDVMFRQYVSPALAAQTIDSATTVKGQIGCSESSAAQNSAANMRLYVYRPSDSSVVGVLIEMLSGGSSSTPPEFATSATNRKFPRSWTGSGTTVAGAVTTQDGDVLVFEVGLGASSTSTTNASLRLGDPTAGSDLAEDETTTTDDRPWLEISQTILYSGEGSSNATVTGVRATSTGTAQPAGPTLNPASDRSLATATAQPAGPTVAATGAQASATATAQPAAATISLLGVRASATATAQPGTPNITATGAQASSTATGQSGTVRLDQTVIATQASATATAQPGTPLISVTVSVAGVQASATGTGASGGVGMLTAWVAVTTNSITLIGSRATATATAQPGTPVAGTNVSVTGVRASATATAQSGGVGMLTAWTAAVTSLNTVTGVRALATATGQGGVAQVNEAIVGVRALATATGRPGAAASPTIMGPGLAWMFMSGAVTGVAIPGVRALATATAQPGTTSITGNATITGGRAEATASDTDEPSFLVAATGARATATATGQAGVPATGVDATVQGIRAEATAASVESSVAVSILGTQATSTATAQAGGVSTSILSVRASATAAAQTGDFLLIVTGSQASATATGTSGATLVVGADRLLSGVTAQATATAQTGSILLSQALAGAQANATGSAQAGIPAIHTLVDGSRSLATATGQAGSLVFTNTLAGTQASALAVAQPGDLFITSTVIGERAIATATGLPGRGGAGASATTSRFTRVNIGSGRTLAGVSATRRTRVRIIG